MCGCASGLSVGGSDWHARWLRLPSDQDGAIRAGGATLARTAGGPLVDGERGWAGGCPTDDVHPLLLEHPGLDLCAPSTTDAQHLWGMHLPTHPHHPPGGHQQYEPVSLRPLGSPHLGLREVAATAHARPFHLHSIQKRIHNFGKVIPVLVRACSLPDQVLLRTICQKVLHSSLKECSSVLYFPLAKHTEVKTAFLILSKNSQK